MDSTRHEADMEFAAEAHRQSAAVAASDATSDDQDFIEAISDDVDADADKSPAGS